MPPGCNLRELRGAQGSAAWVGWESLVCSMLWADGLKEHDSEGPVRQIWGADEAQQNH